MQEKINEYKNRIENLSEQLEQSQEVEALVQELLADLEAVTLQNLQLRRNLLKQSSKESRMSTKLREALYE